jgi:hypothetical protein
MGSTHDPNAGLLQPHGSTSNRPTPAPRRRHCRRWASNFRIDVLSETEMAVLGLMQRLKVSG